LAHEFDAVGVLVLVVGLDDVVFDQEFEGVVDRVVGAIG
jgi:hypothetical protein